MKILLLETLNNLGNFGTKKIVKKGYARNYLIPKNKANIITHQTLQIFFKKKNNIKKEIEININNNLQIYEKIISEKIQIHEKTTERGSLYKPIEKSQLIEKLNTILKTSIKKNNIININNKIKKIGKYTITFQLTPGNIIFNKIINIIKINE